MRVVEFIEIEREIEEVWHFVSDPSNDPVWCPKVKSVDRVGPDRCNDSSRREFAATSAGS